MKEESDGYGGRNGPAYDTFSPRNFDKLLKLKSPKEQAGHVKIFKEKINEKQIIENSEKWNPSHFKPFVTHSPIDYQNKDKQVDPKKSGKI